MWKLLVILFIIKLYARINIFKCSFRLKVFTVIPKYELKLHFNYIDFKYGNIPEQFFTITLSGF